MRLYLANLLIQQRLTPEFLFRLAYQWKHGKDSSTMGDALRYLHRGIIPPYVCEYLQHLERSENVSHSPSQASGGGA